MDDSDDVTDYMVSTFTNAMVLDTDTGLEGLPRPDYEAMSSLEKFSRSTVDRRVLWDLFDLTKTASSLAMAIEAGQAAVEAASEAGVSESEQANANLQLAMLLQIRSTASQNQNLSHLTAAIAQFSKAVILAVDPEIQATCLSNLSGQLSYRYQLADQVEDLVRAEEAARHAVVVSGEDSPHRGTFHYTHALSLRHLYNVTRNDKLLDQALARVKEAVDFVPSHSDSWVLYKTEQANILQYIYDISGNLAHLQAAIEFCEALSDEVEAYDLSPNSNLGGHWQALSELLGNRFGRLHVRDDIDRALQAGANALNALPSGHPFRSSRLGNLADLYFKRFEEYHNKYDLEEAIELADKSLSMVGNNHFRKGQLRNMLSRLLAARYRVFKEKTDIDRAVELMEEASRRSRPGSEDEVHSWGELASVLHSRATVGPADASSEADLARAVELAKKQVSARPAGPERAGSVNNVGIYLLAMHKMTGSPQHLDEAVRYLRECSESETAPPIWRINAAKRAIDVLVAESRVPEADHLLRSAVSLLRKLSPRSLEQKDQQSMIKQFAGLTTLAASVALQTGASAEDALQLLEDGRGIILGLMFEARSDVEVLRTKRPDLAAKFEQLRDEIDDSIAVLTSRKANGPQNQSSQALTRREKATAELDQLLDTIRCLGDQDLEDFLEPPRIDKLKTAARGGSIIVVNVSTQRSDAFIIQPDPAKPVETLPLPEVGLAAIEKWAKMVQSRKISESQMFELLEWLWDSLGRPVLQKLDAGRDMSTSKETHRVWWIPTGPLSSLPIHAAGVYDGRRSSVDNMLARAVSSYSPFIKAMLFTQGNKPSRDYGNSASKSLLVRMGKTEGMKSLSFAKAEVGAVQKLLSPTAKSTDALVVLEEPTKARLLSGLPGSVIFHFAGHGKSDATDPLQSTLLVKDWKHDPLTVKDLMALKLHRDPPLLAYLSACSTGSNKADDLLDEGLHLMSACQLVGFRHVIGSLWSVSDRYSVNVARQVYSAVTANNMSDGSVSQSLQEAVRGLHEKKRLTADGSSREASGPADPAARLWSGCDPRIWAAYIHIGP
ncbi:TPR domain-containing protein [Fusarium austroafricanum]|uniref:TPR domain-containing protein n=1 Tax=Fusarium austroafricanum TaxID=2364996 RepID=A0A8H4JTF5_9HYPO|nr:TPR domain-containing protein [Fusarium austroafricanum]